MTCGVIMLYYAQHTRPITDFAGIKGPSKIGRRGHLAAARAVNELCDAVARLAPAAASQHYDCLTAADILQRINDNSATMVNRDAVKPNCGRKRLLRDNYIIRSIKKLSSNKSTVAEGCAGFNLAASDALRLRNAREGVFVKGGYPFMFISPFDLKIMYNKSGEARTMFVIARN